MSVPSIKELKAIKQVPHRHLMTKWIRESGFTMRDCRRGSSHIRCTHKESPDIVFDIVRDADTVGSLMRFTAALVEIEKRRQEALKVRFENAALDIKSLLEQKIPADLQYRLTDSGNIVLTDRAYPQVGLTFTQKDARLAENKVRELTAIKREYAVMLYRMTNEHDVAPAHMDNGVYNGHLHHLVYDHMPEETLPLYQEHDEPANALEQLNAYIEKIQDIDLEHVCRKEDALSNPVIRQTLVTCASRRGERHNHIYYDGANGKMLKFTFNSFSNQRTTYNGTTARISLSELEKLERVVSVISASAERHLKAA